jgi:hypothetical protein
MTPEAFVNDLAFGTVTGGLGGPAGNGAKQMLTSAIKAEVASAVSTSMTTHQVAGKMGAQIVANATKIITAEVGTSTAVSTVAGALLPAATTPAPSAHSSTVTNGGSASIAAPVSTRTVLTPPTRAQSLTNQPNM